MVSVTVRRPRPVLVEAQAVGRDGRRPVVAQRGGAAGPAVHILHVHAAVAAGQVVLTHPVEQKKNRTHKCAALIYSFYVRTSAQTGIEPDLCIILVKKKRNTHRELLHNCGSICDTPSRLVKWLTREGQSPVSQTT